MKDVKKNFIYNIVYQILIYLLPLITIPYVSRILGANGVGQYSYTYSIVYYFMMFAMLGLKNYGNRSIAKVRDDKTEMSIVFKEIYLFQLITSITMISLYILYLLFFCRQYLLISAIEIMYVISCMFDINWFFFGVEKFKLTITRNIFVKLISLILIFMFVRKVNDVWIYALILSFCTFLSEILLFPFLKKYVDFSVKIEHKNIKKHFIPCLKLFLPVIAVAIYKVMDKTMIGYLSNVKEVGFYSNAEKIINIPNAIIAALGTVMLPRMTNIYSKNDSEKARKIIEKSMTLMMFLCFPMVLGLVAVGNNFTLIFFGNEFAPTGKIIMLLAVTCIFISWGNVIRTQYLIPKEMDKEYIISSFIGAIVNVFLNYIFIPKYYAIGACIGTIVAEFFVSFYQTMSVSKKLPIYVYIKQVLPFIIKSFVMFIIIYLINFINISLILKLFLQIILGVVIYFVLNVKYIHQLVNIKKILKQIKNKYIINKNTK